MTFSLGKVKSLTQLLLYREANFSAIGPWRRYELYENWIRYATLLSIHTYDICAKMLNSNHSKKIFLQNFLQVNKILCKSGAV